MVPIPKQIAKMEIGTILRHSCTFVNWGRSSERRSHCVRSQLTLFDGTSYVTPSYFIRGIRPNPVYLCSYNRLQRLFCYVHLCVAEYWTWLGTLKELVSMSSLNTTRHVPLTGVLSLMQLYVPGTVVVLAIVSLGNESLNITGQKPLTGASSLTRPTLHYPSTLEGSFQGRSGICSSKAAVSHRC
jgi:hypothetical protein